MPENGNAFKHLISPEVVKRMASVFKNAHPPFNKNKFESLVPELLKLELKARAVLLRDGLMAQLPESFKQAAKIVEKVLDSKGLKGFELWPVSEYISAKGLEDYGTAFGLMYKLTPLFTSEFAIRPFLLKDHEASLKLLGKWIDDPNEHVRRWISEGTRPILPWGGKIPAFINDPKLTLELLEKLKWDESLYVRKSVANHLNDISKNHPELVVEVLRQWEEEAPSEHQTKIEWIKRHALRVLIKKAHPGALSLMGAKEKVAVSFHGLVLKRKRLRTGDFLEFDISLSSNSRKDQKLIVDYLIHFVKANGTLSPKVFKLRTLELAAGAKVILSRKHPLKKITTMRFFKGEHLLSIQINGKIYEKASWYFDP